MDNIELSFQQVWQALQESFRHTERLFQETDQRIEKLFQETDRRFQETDRKFQETDQRIEKLFQETDRRFQETDRKFQETDRKFQETDRKFDKCFRTVKEFDSNWGKLVEALIRPSVAGQFRKRGIQVTGSGQRIEKHRQGDTLEIDILLTNGEIVIAVEVKTTLTVEGVQEHIDKHLRPFKQFFPEYHDKQVYGAVAYLHVAENADRYAYKQGLFVLTLVFDDQVIIQNDDKFIPKSWG